MPSCFPLYCRLAWPLLSALLLAACAASNPRSEIAVYTKPIAPELAEIRSLAVLPFDKDRDEKLTRSVETLLTNATLTDRTQAVQRPVSVVGLDRTRGAFRSLDPVGVNRLAASLGVDALLRGEVLQSSTATSPLERTRTECTQTAVEKDRKGRDVTRCVQTRRVTVPCVKHSAVATVAYQVVDKSGRIITRQSVSSSEEDFACEGRRVHFSESTVAGFAVQSFRDVGGQIRPLSDLLAAATVATAEKIRDQLVPQHRSISVEWLSDTNGIRSAAAKESVAQALKFVAAGRADRACELFREAYVAEQQSTALHYNVGLCDESEGQVESALSRYVIADKMLNSPNSIISAALSRARDQVRAIDLLAQRRPELLDAPVVARTEPVRTQVPQLSGALFADPRVQAAVNQQRRVALVIGNSRYRSVAALRNAVNDAKDVEQALKRLSFNVLSGFDLTHQQTLALIQRFRANLRPGDVALVFFAGHGISIDNSNFLLPVDFQPDFSQSAAAARSKSMDLEQTLVPMMRSAGVRLSMVVADACREIPQISSATRSLSRGLAAPRSMASGTIIIYAAGAGQTAADGTGRNGVFTAKFLQAIAAPNVDIKRAMDWVALSVANETGGMQTPSVYSELTGDFFFSLAAGSR